MAQIHFLHSQGSSYRFQRIIPSRLPGFNRTESASPGAYISQDHDRRRASIPAFIDIGAASCFTNRMQIICFNDLINKSVSRTHLQPDFWFIRIL
jgi:hypothetical protein